MHTLHWASRTYGERLVLAVSFGGLGGLVLLDLALRIDPALAVFYLDTGLLFAQTHALVEEVEARYGIRAIRVVPDMSLDEQARVHGDELWKRDPDTCCTIRKITPQRAFLKPYDAWITGLHQSTLRTRREIPRVQWDGGAGLVKISPLAHWTAADLLAYAREHEIPQNSLLSAGYASIGCVPCTVRVQPGADARSGRWPGFTKTECGLHFSPATGDPETVPESGGVL